MNDQIVIVGEQHDKSLQERAGEVLKRLGEIKEGIISNYWDLCDLLHEASEGDYHNVWGYDRFDVWVEQASGLDISARQAFYLITIKRKADLLGLTRDQLKDCKLSKLKEIFSLNVDKYKDDILDLLQNKDLPLDEVRSKVKKLKGIEDEEMVYKTIKIPTLAWETIQNALDLVRSKHGSTTNEFGEVVEIPDGRALELMSAEYLGADGELSQAA